jgi:hypothetical protein
MSNLTTLAYGLAAVIKTINSTPVLQQIPAIQTDLESSHQQGQDKKMQDMPGMKMDKSKDKKPQDKKMQDMPGMKMDQGKPGMKAILGNWPASRDGSGTSWQPDNSPMFMRGMKPLGGFDMNLMGTIQGGYVRDGGKRGDAGFFSNSMLMFMGRQEKGDGTLGIHLMTSLDPIINGRRGVPNLFQNPFDINGVDVSDRKDPHNIFAEVALSYSKPLSKDLSGFLYGGPVGEPALGNVMYFHRTSAVEIPEAPISHDWFDGSHISNGVATVGLVYKDKWKVEGSVFNGHEPSNLYSIGTIGLNSASTRLSYNPTKDWSYSASYGYLNSDVNEHRLTASAAYSHDMQNGDNFSATAYFGQNIVQGSDNSNAWLAEATFYHGVSAWFGRFERVDKDDLVGVPPGSFTINKLLFGCVHTFCVKDGFDYGCGAYACAYSYPSSLEQIYGKSPITLGVFLRVRPSRMKMDSMTMDKMKM